MKNEKKGLFSLMSRIDGMSNQFTKTDWKSFSLSKLPLRNSSPEAPRVLPPKLMSLMQALYDLHKK